MQLELNLESEKMLELLHGAIEQVILRENYLIITGDPA